MTDLTTNHPAVEAAARVALADGWTCDTHEPEQWGSCPDCTALHLSTAPKVLTAALPHLTADDLRDTDAAEEIRTEGWMQGWAAGRDLDGDEDAIPYLRNTPAGRALMAVGWDQGWRDRKQYDQDIDWRTIPVTDTNPYLEGDA